VQMCTDRSANKIILSFLERIAVFCCCLTKNNIIGNFLWSLQWRRHSYTVQGRLQ